MRQRYSHECRMCGAETTNTKPAGPLRCGDCGSYGAGTFTRKATAYDEKTDRVQPMASSGDRV